MKIFFLFLILSTLFTSHTQAQNLPIRVPTKAMDYTKFGTTLS